MKKWSTIRTVALSAVLLAGTALTGCGKSQSTSGDASGASSDSGEKKVVNVALWDENVKDVMNKSIEIYKKDHPNVEVKVTYTPWADYWSKLQTSLAGKGGPDVFWMNGPNIYKYASTGWLKDVDSKVSEDKIDKNSYTKALVDLYTYNGKLYGMPYFLDCIGLYYNKELFDKAGVKYPDASWTWQNLEDAAKKLTDKNNGVYGYAARISNQDGYYNLIHQNGGFIISDDKKKSGFDDPATVEALKFTKKLMDEGVSPNATQQIETDPKDLFKSGKIAMMPGISVVAPEIQKVLGDKVNVAPLPAGKQKAAIVHGLAWVMNSNTKVEKEAWDLMKVLSGQDGEKLLADSGFSIPALKGTEDGWVKSIPSMDLKIFTDSLEFGVPYPVSQETAKWQDVENKEIQDAFLGKKSFEDATKKVADEMNKILSEEK